MSWVFVSNRILCLDQQIILNSLGQQVSLLGVGDLVSPVQLAKTNKIDNLCLCIKAGLFHSHIEKVLRCLGDRLSAESSLAPTDQVMQIISKL